MAVGLPPEDLAREEETLTRAESAGSPGITFQIPL